MSALDVHAGTAGSAEWPGSAALASSTRIAVAEGSCGHGTGWLAARRVVRTLSHSAHDATVLGAAADPVPRGRWMVDFAEPPALALPSDLVEALRALSKVLVIRRTIGDLSLDAECTALAIDGRTLRGAHVGGGRVVVRRTCATGLEDLVQKHAIDLGGFSISTGGLAVPNAPIDRFEITLGEGDVVLASSRPLEIPDAALTETLAQPEPLPELARRITLLHRGIDVAFVLIR